MRRALITCIPLAIIVAALTTFTIWWIAPDDFGRSSAPADVTLNDTTPGTGSPTTTATPTPTPRPLTEAERYRQAIDQRDAGDLDAAAAQLEALADGGGLLAPFARFRLAQVLATAGEQAAAVEAFRAALAEPALPEVLRPIAYNESAAALAALDRVDEAIEALTTMIDDPGATAGERASALWSRLELRQAEGDPGWTEDALALIVENPGYPTAPQALDELEAIGLEAPALAAAYTRYLARDNDAATVRYEAILEGEPDDETAAVAWFYLGALAERVPDHEAAIAAYGESIAVDPDGSRADDAAYWRGRVAEEAGDFEAAAEFYTLLVSEYSASGFADDGALRGALALVEADDVPGALDQLAVIAAARGPRAAAAARWYDLIAGPDARAAAGVPAATEIDPASFAALLEAAGPAALDPPLNEPLPDQDPDTAAVDTWLRTEYGPASPSSGDIEAILLNTVAILVDAGEHSLARALFAEALDLTDADPRVAIELSLRATALDLPDIALIAAIRQVGRLPVFARLAIPPAVEQLAYPAPWPDLLTAASDEFQVPPLLLLALIRQESAFQPDVISPAGAVGLTQVIPPTGAQVASTLDEVWRGPASLTEPETSLRYGAAYLGTQLERFDGNMFAALAAYNAGPANAQRWLDTQTRAGADGYVLAIDFEETRRYVNSVIEQYGWYRYVYGLSETPSIR